MNVIILGSTGSLGSQALNILAKYDQYFQVVGLCANTNKKLLQEQARKLDIPLENVVLASEQGPLKVAELAHSLDADIIINVLSGIAGVKPSKAALKSGKTVLLGNKESLVAKGKEVMSLAKGRLIPVDSEHNAIFEILQRFSAEKIRKIYLPCSGGPFLGKNQDFLQGVTVEQAIAHPKWKMGAKISIESATLLNKGLEILEAHYLFDLPLKKIDVFIHPEAHIHGIVEFENGEAYAYISPPNMEEHLENGLLHVIGKSNAASRIQKIDLGAQALQPPDHETFPGIKIVLEAFKKSPSSMDKFLKKEEQVIESFLQNQITFPEIFSSLS